MKANIINYDIYGLYEKNILNIYSIDIKSFDFYIRKQILYSNTLLLRFWDGFEIKAGNSIHNENNLEISEIDISDSYDLINHSLFLKNFNCIKFELEGDTFADFYISHSSFNPKYFLRRSDRVGLYSGFKTHLCFRIDQSNYFHTIINLKEYYVRGDTFGDVLTKSTHGYVPNDFLLVLDVIDFHPDIFYNIYVYYKSIFVYYNRK
jgi:hypothetical protein